MYSVVLLLAATTNVEATSCHRLFRNRDCCQPCCPAPVCQPAPAPCCGTAPGAPSTVAPKPAVLTAVEEKQLAEIVGILKKGPKSGPSEISQYEIHFKSLTPAERMKEYKDLTAVAPAPPPGPPALTKDEEKMLKELLEQFSAKDKAGKVKLADPEALKKYEMHFRSLNHEQRLKEYKEEFKAPSSEVVPAPKGAQLDAPARIIVDLPADARLTVDGHKTQSTTDHRVFVSPAITVEGLHFYEFTATVERNGMQIQVTRLVRVRAGQTTHVSIEEPMVGAAYSQR